MRKAITTLLATVMILSVLGVTVAAAASTTYATDQRPTQITITSYPKQVKVGESFNIVGQLSSDGQGLGDKLIYFNFWNTTDHTWYWLLNFTTNPDGSFTNIIVIPVPGSQTYRFDFWGDDQYAPCVSHQIVVTATQ